MPTYEYRCANGHDFEEFVLKISAAKSELPCPTCGVRGERRMSAGGGLLFKGSGFYITDYGKDGKKSAATPKGDGAAAASGASSDSGAKEGAKSAASATANGAANAEAKSSKSKSDATPASAPSTKPKGGE